MEEQLTEQSSFFFVVERDEYFNQFDCDKDLNRVCPYVEEKEEGNCYLNTCFARCNNNLKPFQYERDL